MAELRAFSSIDIYDEPDERAKEAAEFLQWADDEGGLAGLLWGHGVGVFPEDLQPMAARYEEMYNILFEAVRLWAAERGVAT